MEILTLAGCLLGIVANHALSFYLAAGEISFGCALKLCCTAQGLNKILFTGTGYLLSAYFSRNTAINASKAMAIFLLLEVVFFAIWIACGLFFGATLLMAHLRIWTAAGAAVLVAAIAVILKRERVRDDLYKIALQLGQMGRRLVLVLPLALVNFCLGIVYYSNLFDYMGHSIAPISVLRVVSIAISIGYLSPAPGGLGVKEVGMMAMLIEQGVPLEEAAAIAIMDRFITTGFWSVLGLAFGFKLFKQEIAYRLRRRSKTPRSF